MKQQTSLHIATPCHENWNEMTPSEKGKFCHQCNQQVVDFTLMSDAQVLRYLSSHTGRLCGRFDAEQLDRPLAEANIPKKKSWYLALSLPLLLLFEKSTAQVKSRLTGAPSAVRIEQRTITGDTIIPLALLAPPLPEWITVHGTVRDDEGNPLPYASIILKGIGRGTIADSAAMFSIDLPANSSPVTLVASYLGFSTIEKTIDTKEAATPVDLALTIQPVMIGEIVAITGMVIPRQVRSKQKQTSNLCPKITGTEKADSAFRKITGSSYFSLYPNPASAGSEIKLRIKKEGQYKLQFLDNNSAPLKTETINTTADAATVSFTLPAQIAAGIYYMRLIKTANGKSFLEKIIIR